VHFVAPVAASFSKRVKVICKGERNLECAEEKVNRVIRYWEGNG